MTLLLDHGANVNALDSQNQSYALHQSVNVDHPNLKMVKLLLDHGAHVNAQVRCLKCCLEM